MAASDHGDVQPYMGTGVRHAVPLLPKRVASAAVQLLAKALGRASRDGLGTKPAPSDNPAAAVGGKPLLGRESGPKARTRDMEQRIVLDVLRRTTGQQRARKGNRTSQTAADDGVGAVRTEVSDAELQ
jgi:hypothetical protein